MVCTVSDDDGNIDTRLATCKVRNSIDVYAFDVHVRSDKQTDTEWKPASSSNLTVLPLQSCGISILRRYQAVPKYSAESCATCQVCGTVTGSQPSKFCVGLYHPSLWPTLDGSSRNCQKPSR